MNARTAAAMVALAVVAVAGCDGGAEPPSRSGSPTPPGASPAAGCPDPGAGTADARSQLIPGPSNNLPRSPATGEPLIVEAVVLARDCRPAPGADVRVWHTDARGRYGPAEGRCCYYAGVVRTDAGGRFRLRSVRPAQYPVPDAPPAHIHLEIRHAAASLETEIIFDGRPVPVPLLPSGHVVPMELRRDGAGWRGAVAFVLPGAG
jgi:protocatechuate 3,4-dioxygenase beta subunit